MVLLCLLIPGAYARGDTAMASPSVPVTYIACISCHGSDGWGSPAIHAPPIAGQPANYTRQQLLHFTLTTMTPRYRFTPHRLAAVSEAFPAVEALAQCHWSALPKERQQPPGLRQQLQLTLAAFGKSLLTLREQEVIELVLLGHSTPRIAEHFQLSVETVKLHRKNAYAKLEVNSQAELFHLFMDCMLVKTTKTQEDPVPIVHSKRAERG